MPRAGPHFWPMLPEVGILMAPTRPFPRPSPYLSQFCSTVPNSGSVDSEESFRNFASSIP